jgi:hypothetical protein
LDNLKRDRTKLYQYFRPSLAQLTFFLISNFRRFDLSQHGSFLSSALDSSLHTEKVPIVEQDSPPTGDRKRDAKSKHKKISDEVTASNTLLNQKIASENTPPTGKQRNKDLREIKDLKNGPILPNATKRVKFSKTITQVDFLKQAPIEEDTEMKSLLSKSESSSSDEDDDDEDEEEEEKKKLEASQQKKKKDSEAS